MATYEDESRCRTYLLDALTKEMDKRHLNKDTWIENERFAITAAANAWADAHGLPVRLTVDEVENVEQLAVGHVDYGRKLALYVAETLYGYRPVKY